MSERKDFQEELSQRLETPRNEYQDDADVDKIMQEAERRPFKIGSLEGIVSPPPADFFAPLTEEELREWEGDPDDPID